MSVQAWRHARQPSYDPSDEDLSPGIPNWSPALRPVFTDICVHGFWVMAMGTVAEFPEAARPRRLVATPDSDVGIKVTVPSTAEVAVEDCFARSAPWAQMAGGAQGGVKA